MHFNEAETRAIAVKGGINEKAVVRLLGSLPITFSFGEDGANGEGSLGTVKKVDIGLRVTGKEVLPKLERPILLDLIGTALREYSRVCPYVSAWVGRGDFDPKKLPDRATGAVITHACRTAGRLRAKLMRKLTDS